MHFRDDDLTHFEAHGAELPSPDSHAYVDHDGASVWWASFGSGPPVVLLHGGLGHSGNWGHQVVALRDAGYRAISIDSRGHGRSTRDARPYSYEFMASDVLAVLDAERLQAAHLVGWSDGACTALILADQHPTRASSVFFFACNMDPSGTKEFVLTPIVERCFHRHTLDYERLSSTPEAWQEFVEAVGQMQRTQPNYSAQDLAKISVPVTVAHAELDEFIKREHAEYLAKTIPGARFELLPEVSHFAPLQRPAQFDDALLRFLSLPGRA